MRGVSVALEIDSASSFGHYVAAAGLLSARPTKSQSVKESIISFRTWAAKVTRSVSSSQEVMRCRDRT